MQKWSAQEKKGGPKIEAPNEKRQECTILNLLWCQVSPSCAACQTICAFSEP